MGLMTTDMYDVKFLDSTESFKGIFLKFDSFLPPPPIALSVVSMEVFAPHKMAEIRARHSNEGVKDLRYVRSANRYFDRHLISRIQFLIK